MWKLTVSYEFMQIAEELMWPFYFWLMRLAVFVKLVVDYYALLDPPIRN
jgi:hypothetical protein